MHHLKNDINMDLAPKSITQEKVTGFDLKDDIFKFVNQPQPAPADEYAIRDIRHWPYKPDHIKTHVTQSAKEGEQKLQGINS